MNRRDYLKFLELLLLFAVMLVTGCDEDKRVAQLSKEAADRQAEQNQLMARQSQQTAEATKELVAADAKARKDLTALQQNLREDQAEIGKKRDDLELERQKIAAEKNWDRLLAPVLSNFGVFLVITAALSFCGYILMGLRHEKTTDASVEELLIEELVSEHPRLLPPMQQKPALDCLERPKIEDLSQETTKT
jgi:hypothetical protein